jgi:hypothetical protein
VAGKKKYSMSSSCHGHGTHGLPAVNQIGFLRWSVGAFLHADLGEFGFPEQGIFAAF